MVRSLRQWGPNLVGAPDARTAGRVAYRPRRPAPDAEDLGEGRDRPGNAPVMVDPLPPRQERLAIPLDRFQVANAVPSRFGGAGGAGGPLSSAGTAASDPGGSRPWGSARAAASLRSVANLLRRGGRRDVLVRPGRPMALAPAAAVRQHPRRRAAPARRDRVHHPHARRHIRRRVRHQCPVHDRRVRIHGHLRVVPLPRWPPGTPPPRARPRAAARPGGRAGRRGHRRTPRSAPMTSGS
jgi:hypothetical protein